MVITMLLSSLIGVALGMLGGGGSVLTVPMLIGVGGLGERQALTTSLAMVVAMAAVAAVPHWRAGNVNVRQAVLFAALGAVGAALGGAVSRRVPTAVLVNGFAVIMLATGTAMLRGGRRSTQSSTPSTVRSAAVALAAGSLTGLVGAGGGFVLVPALTLFAGLSMPQAVGTSLVVIAVQGAVALTAQLRTNPLEISFVAPL
ncbi:MAG: sulfite exporter TauE/SafE family protein, partial [Deltaproteobacteria bacterium]|nr:sulfite exporter TauE/SafE family protein [Deltaproteobacteria bacterium]